MNESNGEFESPKSLDTMMKGAVKQHGDLHLRNKCNYSRHEYELLHAHFIRMIIFFGNLAKHQTIGLKVCAHACKSYWNFVCNSFASRPQKFWFTVFSLCSIQASVFPFFSKWNLQSYNSGLNIVWTSISSQTNKPNCVPNSCFNFRILESVVWI